MQKNASNEDAKLVQKAILLFHPMYILYAIKFKSIHLAICSSHQAAAAIYPDEMEAG